MLFRSGNDAALERVINIPARGIGEKTVEAIRDHARHADVSMWEAMRLLPPKHDVFCWRGRPGAGA